MIARRHRGERASGIATGVALAFAALAIWGCSDGDAKKSDPSPAPALATPTPTIDIETQPTPLPPTRKLVFDGQPRPAREATPATLVGEPCDFPAWDQKTALIHDLETCETILLGNGVNVIFNEESTHAAWIERTDIERPGPVWVVELRSGARTLLADADSVGFSALGNLHLTQRGSSSVATFNAEGTPVDEPQPPFPTPTVGPRSEEVSSAPDGYRLFRSQSHSAQSARYVVTDRAGDPLWEFDSGAAYAIGDRLLVTTASTNSTPQARYEGTQNLYLLDPGTGDSEFLATVSADHQASGDDSFVMWSEGFCSGTGNGTTHILDHLTGVATKLDFALQGSIEEDGTFVGFVRQGEFIFDRIVFDIGTLEAEAFFREYGAWTRSDDGRYFAERLFRGGGLCI